MPCRDMEWLSLWQSCHGFSWPGMSGCYISRERFVGKKATGDIWGHFLPWPISCLANATTKKSMQWKYLYTIIPIFIDGVFVFSIIFNLILIFIVQWWLCRFLFKSFFFGRSLVFFGRISRPRQRLLFQGYILATNRRANLSVNQSRSSNILDGSESTVVPPIYILPQPIYKDMIMNGWSEISLNKQFKACIG